MCHKWFKFNFTAKRPTALQHFLKRLLLTFLNDQPPSNTFRNPLSALAMHDLMHTPLQLNMLIGMRETAFVTLSLAKKKPEGAVWTSADEAQVRGHEARESA